MSWEGARNFVINKFANSTLRIKAPYKALINEKNFDVHISASHGIAFLKYLKKINFKLWKQFADNGRSLDVFKNNDTRKKALLDLFNKFCVSYRTAMRKRPHKKQPPGIFQKAEIATISSAAILKLIESANTAEKGSPEKSSPGKIVADFAVFFIEELVRGSSLSPELFFKFVSVVAAEFEKKRGKPERKNIFTRLHDFADFSVKNWKKLLQIYSATIGINNDILKFYNLFVKLKSFCELAVKTYFGDSLKNTRERLLLFALRHKGFEPVNAFEGGSIIARDKNTGNLLSFNEQDLINYGHQNETVYRYLLGEVSSLSAVWGKEVDEFLDKFSLGIPYKKAIGRLKSKYGDDTNIASEDFRLAARLVFKIFIPPIKFFNKKIDDKVYNLKSKIFEIIKYKVTRENVNLNNGYVKISDNLALMLDFTGHGLSLNGVKSALYDSRIVKLKNLRTGKFIKVDLYNMPSNILKSLNNAFLDVEKSRTYLQRFANASIDNAYDAGGVEYIFSDSLAGAAKGILFDMPAVGVECAANPLLAPLFFLNAATPEGFEALAKDFIDTVHSQDRVRIGAYFSFNLTMAATMAFHGIPRLKTLGEKVVFGVKELNGRLQFSLKGKDGKEIILTPEEARKFESYIIGTKPVRVTIVRLGDNGEIIPVERKTVYLKQVPKNGQVKKTPSVKTPQSKKSRPPYVRRGKTSLAPAYARAATIDGRVIGMAISGENKGLKIPKGPEKPRQLRMGGKSDGIMSDAAKTTKKVVVNLFIKYENLFPKEAKARKEFYLQFVENLKEELRFYKSRKYLIKDPLAFEAAMEKSFLTAINTTKHKFLNESILKTLQNRLKWADFTNFKELKNLDLSYLMSKIELLIPTLYAKAEFLLKITNYEEPKFLKLLKDTLEKTKSKLEALDSENLNIRHVHRFARAVLSANQLDKMMKIKSKMTDSDREKLETEFNNCLAVVAKIGIIIKKLSVIDGFNRDIISLLFSGDREVVPLEIKKLYNLCDKLSPEEIKENADAIVKRINSIFYVRNRYWIIEENIREELGIMDADKKLNDLSDFVDKCYLEGKPEKVRTLIEMLNKYIPLFLETENIAAKRKLYDEFLHQLNGLIKEEASKPLSPPANPPASPSGTVSPQTSVSPSKLDGTNLLKTVEHVNANTLPPAKVPPAGENPLARFNPLGNLFIPSPIAVTPEGWIIKSNAIPSKDTRAPKESERAQQMQMNSETNSRGDNFDNGKMAGAKPATTAEQVRAELTNELKKLNADYTALECKEAQETDFVQKNKITNTLETLKKRYESIVGKIFTELDATYRGDFLHDFIISCPKNVLEAQASNIAFLLANVVIERSGRLEIFKHDPSPPLNQYISECNDIFKILRSLETIPEDTLKIIKNEIPKVVPQFKDAKDILQEKKNEIIAVHYKHIIELIKKDETLSEFLKNIPPEARKSILEKEEPAPQKADDLSPDKIVSGKEIKKESDNQFNFTKPIFELTPEYVKTHKNEFNLAELLRAVINTISCGKREKNIAVIDLKTSLAKIKGKTASLKIEVAEDLSLFANNHSFITIFNNLIKYLVKTFVQEIKNAEESEDKAGLQELPDKDYQINIKAKLYPETNQLEIIIEDNGSGVKPEDRAKLFESAAGEGKTTTQEPEKTSSELKWVKEQVEYNGGKISERGEFEKGANLVIVFKASDILSQKYSPRDGIINPLFNNMRAGEAADKTRYNQSIPIPENDPARQPQKKPQAALEAVIRGDMPENQRKAITTLLSDIPLPIIERLRSAGFSIVIDKDSALMSNGCDEFNERANSITISSMPAGNYAEFKEAVFYEIFRAIRHNLIKSSEAENLYGRISGEIKNKYGNPTRQSDFLQSILNRQKKYIRNIFECGSDEFYDKITARLFGCFFSKNLSVIFQNGEKNLYALMKKLIAELADPSGPPNNPYSPGDSLGRRYNDGRRNNLAERLSEHQRAGAKNDDNETSAVKGQKDTPVSPVLPNYQDAIKMFLSDDGKLREEKIPDLIKALKSPNKYIREIAARFLYDLGPFADNVISDAVKALTESITTDEVAEVRGSAIFALWRGGGNTEEIVSVIAGALKDPDEMVRISAVQGLELIADNYANKASAVSALKEALNNPSKKVHKIASEALKEILKKKVNTSAPAPSPHGTLIRGKGIGNGSLLPPEGPLSAVDFENPVNPRAPFSFLQKLFGKGPRNTKEAVEKSLKDAGIKNLKYSENPVEIISSVYKENGWQKAIDFYNELLKNNTVVPQEYITQIKGFLLRKPAILEAINKQDISNKNKEWLIPQFNHFNNNFSASNIAESIREIVLKYRYETGFERGDKYLDFFRDIIKNIEDLDAGFASEFKTALAGSPINTILCVCKENARRSPEMQYFLNTLLQESYPGRFKVESAGTEAEDGYVTTNKINTGKGYIEIKTTTKKLTAQMLEEADVVFTPDHGISNKIDSLMKEEDVKNPPVIIDSLYRSGILKTKEYFMPMFRYIDGREKTRRAFSTDKPNGPGENKVVRDETVKEAEKDTVKNPAVKTSPETEKETTMQEFEDSDADSPVEIVENRIKSISNSQGWDKAVEFYNTFMKENSSSFTPEEIERIKCVLIDAAGEKSLEKCGVKADLGSDFSVNKTILAIISSVFKNNCLNGKDIEFFREIIKLLETVEPEIAKQFKKVIAGRRIKTIFCVCSNNWLRSPTAQFYLKLFLGNNFAVDSAGLSALDNTINEFSVEVDGKTIKKTNITKKLTPEMVEKADILFVNKGSFLPLIIIEKLNLPPENLLKISEMLPDEGHLSKENYEPLAQYVKYRNKLYDAFNESKTSTPQQGQLIRGKGIGNGSLLPPEGPLSAVDFENPINRREPFSFFASEEDKEPATIFARMTPDDSITSTEIKYLPSVPKQNMTFITNEGIVTLSSKEEKLLTKLQNELTDESDEDYNIETIEECLVDGKFSPEELTNLLDKIISIDNAPAAASLFLKNYAFKANILRTALWGIECDVIAPEENDLIPPTLYALDELFTKDEQLFLKILPAEKNYDSAATFFALQSKKRKSLASTTRIARRIKYKYFIQQDAQKQFIAEQLGTEKQVLESHLSEIPDPVLILSKREQILMQMLKKYDDRETAINQIAWDANKYKATLHNVLRFIKKKYLALSEKQKEKAAAELGIEKNQLECLIGVTNETYKLRLFFNEAELRFLKLLSVSKNLAKARRRFLAETRGNIKNIDAQDMQFAELVIFLRKKYTGLTEDQKTDIEKQFRFKPGTLENILGTDDIE